ncbi:MAG: acetylornithine aminotransferase [Desulfobacterales bacterium C00003060]|nr:MAG: acetylornithine aminotransferase [Desulfobacterales bacterium S3730MH5]OEU79551.1 MAG: acetylornithine aminotransferase [Desulfobacterales bacterium C00003060]OEU80810.1 MAG: acetylornithine aminotransferase [Desulfobacterales bacterium S5133MH4]
MKNNQIKTADQVMAATYTRFPIVLTKGDGCTLWDATGREYTDFVAGIAVCNLGHAHPGIAKAIADQARRLVHVSNLYYTRPQIELAEWLVEHSFADRVFFCNSGAEANEAAIKLVRKYFRDRGVPERFRIITTEGSFHGRTMATLSATGQPKIRKGFEPMLEGFDIVAFNDLEAVREAVTEESCAVMVEPIQGEGGVRSPVPGYLEGLREICDREGLLLIFDEVQTGMGRTGKLFAYEHFAMTPDIMTLAKALANGLPMGAMLAKEKVAAAFTPGSHASTFGGTPLVAAAALVVAKALVEEGVLSNCERVGRYFKDRLLDLKSKHTFIKDVRGEGLLLGLDLAIDGVSIVKACMERGFLINCAQEHILRFIPPLIIQEEQIDSLIVCLDAVFEDLSRKSEG